MTTKDELTEQIRTLLAENTTLRQQLDQQQEQITQMRFVEQIDRDAVNRERVVALTQEVLWLRGVIERAQGLTEPSAVLSDMVGNFLHRPTWGIL